MTIGVDEHVRARPDDVAVVSDGERLTWGAFWNRIRELGAGLAARGIGEGARIGVALPNGPDALALVFAAGGLGVECVPIPWRATDDERAYYVQDSSLALVVDDADAIAGDGGTPAMRSPVIPLLRFYTSGTTGRPKAVVRARPAPDDYLTGVRGALGRIGVVGPDEVHLVCGPLYHAAPLAYALYALMAGHRVVVPSRFDAARTLSLIETERITWSMMAPVHFIRILALPESARAGRDLSSVRRILHAAAPCPIDVKRAIMEMFPGAVWEFYGMTEGRGTLITAEEWERKPGSVGRPYPGVTIEIRDDDGAVLPAGATGRVFVRDGATFSYDGAPDKTARAWEGDAYTVGDIGHLDEDGYLFLTDRADDVIITGGSNVYPAEVEAALHRHADVVDCAVVGIPDDDWGERILAVVESRAPLTPDEVQEHVRGLLADYKCPRAVVFVEELPRDAAGKIRRRELRDRYWSGRARRI